MDALLAQLRHRDAVRILIVSVVVSVTLGVSAVLGAEWGTVLDQVFSALLSLSVFSAVVAGLHLRRNRERYARIVHSGGRGR